MLILFIVTLISKTLTNKKECLDESVHILISQGCFDVQVIELSKDAFTDYIILSSATSQRQILATVSKLKALFRLSNKFSLEILSELESNSSLSILALFILKFFNKSDDWFKIVL